MNQAAAELFPHVRIVMGMVIGLGLTRLLTGYASLVQHPKRAPLSLVHQLWALSMLVELVLFWWWEVAMFLVAYWSFAIFAFLILYAVTLYLLCALLFPDKIDEYEGYEDFFLKRRKWFFSILALTFILDVIDTALKGAPYDPLDISYLIQVPVGIALCCVGMWSTNRKVHLGLVLANLVTQVWWITQLWYAPV